MHKYAKHVPTYMINYFLSEAAQLVSLPIDVSSLISLLPQVSIANSQHLMA